MRQNQNITKIAFLLATCLLISACQKFRSDANPHSDNETNSIMALLIKVSDFNKDEFIWEKEFYSLERRFHDSSNGIAKSIIAGKHLQTQFDFVLIHEVILLNNDNSPELSANQYIDTWHEVSIPITESHKAYCSSSEIDYLSSCVGIVNNDYAIASIEVRVFQFHEPTAIDITALGINLFLERLGKSDFK
ncbi:MAG TPA: hypothetical protein PLF42_08455 [Anaerolineales bacterium]|nr:hypothetical protein [Anaerolineales bacterium]